MILTIPISAYANENINSESVSDEYESESSDTENNSDLLPEGKFYLGDINCDRRITASDARNVLKFSAKQTALTLKQCIIADANKNRVVNAQDARLILRMAAKLEAASECKEAKNADDKELLLSYDKRAFYTPQLDGFSTNITDDKVFTKIRSLEKYCANLKGIVTFYYTDINGNYYIQFDSDKVYRTQCTVKAPFVKSMLDYMELNNIPLNKKLYLKDSQKWKGHYVSSFKTGTGFEIGEIMYYALRYSDNTAYQMLFDNFSSKVLNNNAEKIGASLRLDTYIFGETSASDMAKLYRDIYFYDGKYKEEFFGHLKNSETSPLISNGLPDDVEILRKSGSGGNATVGYHDCVVVLTDSPFVLIIYTSINKDKSYDRLPFKRIAENIYSINQSLYS